MNQTINISATATVATIDIEGVIGSEGQNGAVTTYESLREKIAQIEALETPMVVVNIRSVGGDVADALLIYEALLSLDAHITTRCYGYTASAATIIAQAANEGCRQIAQSALYLIHNSSCATEGNAADLTQQAELLQKTDERIAAIYASRSNRTADHFAALMAKNGGDGEWLSPEQALEAGLVDEIIPVTATASATLINRIRSWLGIKEKECAIVDTAIDRVNASNIRLRCTPITLLEGQQRVVKSATIEVDDPDFEGDTLSANAAAYNRDAAAMRNY